MTEQEAKKRAREWSRKSGHAVFVQHFHGGFSISETIDHEGGWLKYSHGRLVDTNLTGDLWISIYHSSFARYTLSREVVPILAWNHGATCKWCGNVSHDHNGKARLFKYSREDDSYGARRSYVDGEFCSVQCMRQYPNTRETP